jgi:hypothetical protein
MRSEVRPRLGRIKNDGARMIAIAGRRRWASVGNLKQGILALWSDTVIAVHYLPICFVCKLYLCKGIVLSSRRASFTILHICICRDAFQPLKIPREPGDECATDTVQRRRHHWRRVLWHQCRVPVAETTGSIRLHHLRPRGRDWWCVGGQQV